MTSKSVRWQRALPAQLLGLHPTFVWQCLGVGASEDQGLENLAQASNTSLCHACHLKNVNPDPEDWWKREGKMRKRNWKNTLTRTRKSIMIRRRQRAG
jgi:hypothetical protein